MNITKEIIQKNKIKKTKGLECVYCGCTNQLILTIDHKIPKSRGGLNEEKNMQVCCYICNQLKGSLTDKEFKIYLKNLYNLKELCKIRLELGPMVLHFNSHHYPDYKLNNSTQSKDKPNDTKEK